MHEYLILSNLMDPLIIQKWIQLRIEMSILKGLGLGHGYMNLYLSIFLYVLTPEGDIRQVPGNQVLGLVSFFFC